MTKARFQCSPASSFDTSAAFDTLDHATQLHSNTLLFCSDAWYREFTHIFPIVHPLFCITEHNCLCWCRIYTTRWGKNIIIFSGDVSSKNIIINYCGLSDRMGWYHDLANKLHIIFHHNIVPRYTEGGYFFISLILVFISSELGSRFLMWNDDRREYILWCVGDTTIVNNNNANQWRRQRFTVTRS